MNLHTLTVTFDDDKLQLDDVIAALGDAGYVAREPKKIE